MKKTREQMKAKLMRVLEKRLDEVLDWQGARPTFRLTELEDYLLGVGEEIQVVLAEEMLGQVESKQPVEAPKCEHCGEKMEYKGQKRKTVVTRLGDIAVERGYYWCPGCRRGSFPPGQRDRHLGWELE
jgi:tRNA(Ile2) C34 agmatinyltransferase TiaS